ncbi:MAG: hypothetical protein V1895_04170 [Parcubacteria group bacterium]
MQQIRRSLTIIITILALTLSLSAQAGVKPSVIDVITSAPVIRHAVAMYAKFHGDHRKTCAVPSGRENSAFYCAQEAYFDAVYGPEWQKGLDTPPLWNALYRYALNQVRDELSNPATLQQAYLAAKPQLLYELRRLHIEKVAKEDLELFSQTMHTERMSPLTADALAIYRKEVARLDSLYTKDAIDETDRRIAVCKLDKDLTSTSHVTHDMFTLSMWAVRRSREGGPEVVRMWTWIADDLIKSL